VGVRFPGLLLLAVLPALVGDHPAPLSASSSKSSVRGIIISTHTDGTDWGTPNMRSTMEDIKNLGADWVSIHPYGWIRGDGTVRFHRFDPENPPAHITHPIAEAHALGLKILIKPHLGYWGSPFSWRGAISFEDDASWEQFFETYRHWITSLAQATRNADAFVVGTELDSTLNHETEWRRIIAEIKERTSLPLTYAANWTHYRNVAFWDDLDVIGIQAYFPISDTPDPAPSDLAAGWEPVMAELREFSREFNRDVVFTELGYNRSYSAPVRPWAYHSDGEDAERTQARCMRAALEAVENEPAVVGVFLWKWFPNPYPVGRNFQLATPGIKRVIAEAWEGAP
jgi:hypothetical protein